MSEILVIGFGSIGARHARVATEDGHNVTVVSRRDAAGDFRRRATISEALEGSAGFDCAIIASETAQHLPDLNTLLAAGFGGQILVEKPLFSTSAYVPAVNGPSRDQIRVGYNLRFHPLLIRLREQLLSAGRVLNVVVHVGQDLHQWRSGRALGQNYSSQKSGGGGVLRDLSHELDYLVWLFGPWRSVTASGGRLGDLPGDADDAWGILLRFETGVLVTLAMDYFCQRPVRTIVVNTVGNTIEVDLVGGVLADAAGETRVSLDRDFTYRAQLRALIGKDTGLCDFDEALAVVRLIEAIEESAATCSGVFR